LQYLRILCDDLFGCFIHMIYMLLHEKSKGMSSQKSFYQ
jgi:hypothetical protein